MTVIVTGRDLSLAEVVRVARGGEPATLEPAAAERMRRTRAIVQASLDRGESIYGASTAVGVLKRVRVDPAADRGYAGSMLGHHRVGQGPAAPRDVVRATMLRLANHLAESSPGDRPELAERILAALNADDVPEVRSIGSVGSADLVPLAELAMPIVAGLDLEPGEGTALLDNNAFATGWAALAVADAATLLDSLDVAGALSLEGFAANPSMLHPAIGEVRPYPGLRRTLARLAALLDGSGLWDAGAPRNLQDPLTFRNLPQIQAAGRDALAHLESILAVELNASQGNPIVVAADERVVSVANFEILPLAGGLDYLRVVLATVLTASAERTVKGLGAPWSGLPTGLVPIAGTNEAGLTYLSLAAQSLAVEARLLAAPVSFELVSTSHAEGIEDRTTMAPLAARRLAEQVALGGSIAAIELAVAAQAAELRGVRLGRGTGGAVALVRAHVPFLRVGDFVPDVGGLADAVRAGAIRAAADAAIANGITNAPVSDGATREIDVDGA
ncbi:MAG: aromatic amino acid lyase [Chloroflexi bacterium]|nr:aromatic amino acid lyase [Chloroflexota bacterium]